MVKLMTKMVRLTTRTETMLMLVTEVLSVVMDLDDLESAFFLLYQFSDAGAEIKILKISNKSGI
eukprot:15365082-Ditylum_brightwellii.AAC.1